MTIKAQLRAAVYFGFVVASFVVASGAVRAQTIDLVSRTELRVCADPSNLPFSNDRREGFENKIADILGRDLNLPVSYVWFPQVAGFVRNTLAARRCDLVTGTVSGDSNMADTNPYYHSAYMIVSRADDKLTAVSLGDPALAGKRIGIVAATPPTDLLLRHDLMAHVTSYVPAADTRYESPGRAMIQDILDHKIDVGLLWGPIANYYIKREKLPLKTAFLSDDKGAVRLDFHIAMGVRANETEWRRRINQALARHRQEISEILSDFGVPQLDEEGRSVEVNVR